MDLAAKKEMSFSQATTGIFCSVLATHTLEKGNITTGSPTGYEETKLAETGCEKLDSFFFQMFLSNIFPILTVLLNEENDK